MKENAMRLRDLLQLFTTDHEAGEQDVDGLLETAGHQAESELYDLVGGAGSEGSEAMAAYKDVVQKLEALEQSDCASQTDIDEAKQAVEDAAMKLVGIVGEALGVASAVVLNLKSILDLLENEHGIVLLDNTEEPA